MVLKSFWNITDSAAIGKIIVLLLWTAPIKFFPRRNIIFFSYFRSGPIKQGKCRVFHGICEEFPSIAVVGTGPKSLAYNELELVDEKKEAVRAAAAGTEELLYR